ncbi:MAG: DUF3696 domain-containing protein [Ruminococcus sp.]
MINNLKIKNFKCFEKLSIELSNLNVFAGINSMGKSSVIQAILLLRQSYEMGTLSKGLHLNGELTQIGTGFDLMYRNSDEDKVSIELTAGDATTSWEYEYNKDSDFQKIYRTNINQDEIIKINIFSPTFSYISAERIGPQRYYKQSYHEIYERNQVGFRGELFADYLAKRGLEDKVENNCVLFDENTSEHLLYQTEKWLSVISPGIHINPKQYQEAGLVGIEYKVYGADYTPVNVGFGLSYVVPIIVSLLKANQGDLVIIENPEAHLHPKGQRKMGELIARASAGGVQVILETHSDHILNGIRLSVKNGVISRNNIRLNYFYQKVESDLALGEKVTHEKCSPVILNDGSLSDWPDGFFDEWDKALDELF